LGSISYIRHWNCNVVFITVHRGDRGERREKQKEKLGWLWVSLFELRPDKPADEQKAIKKYLFSALADIYSAVSASSAVSFF
jgi:hypothetical protein